MKLSTRREIAAPVEAVFARLCEFERFEETARRRGAEVRRVAGGPDAPAAARWDVAFDLRGRRRQTEIDIVAFDAEQQIAARCRFDGLVALGNIELQPLRDARTLLHVSIDLRATAVKARLLLQSLKLARSSLTRRLEARLDQFAQRVENA